MENIIEIKEEVDCNIQTAFNYFINNELLERWLTKKADVNPIAGGRYELFWEIEDKKNNSTIGCKITGIEKNTFISFTWKGPVQFKSFMNNSDPLTHVIVFFYPYSEEQNKTIIYLFHTGWKYNPEWQKAREYFENAWTNALKELKNHVKNRVLV